MSSVREEVYVPTIDAILKVSNLEQITVKKIRYALESLFTVNFSDNPDDKKAINEIILDRFYKMQEYKDNNPDTENSLKETIEKLKEENRKLAKKVDLSLVVRKELRKAKGSKKKKESRQMEKVGFASHKWGVSPELGSFLGSNEPIPRTEVIKKIWEHIKERRLQDPTDRRVILCDKKLKSLLGVDKVHMFSMNKILNDHFIKLSSQEANDNDQNDEEHEQDADSDDEE